MAAPTHYELLGVTPHATLQEIKRRFRALAREHHPDVAGDSPQSHERFIRISEAYQVLGDPNRRAAYDLMLRDRERLLAREGGVAKRTASVRAVPQRRARYGSLATWQVLCGFGGASLVLSTFFCFALIAPGRPNLGLPLVEHWTPRLLLWMVLSGWISGLTLAFSGIAGPLDQELLYPGRRHSGLPVGLLLAATSFICFYVGAALYW